MKRKRNSRNGTLYRRISRVGYGTRYSIKAIQIESNEEQIQDIQEIRPYITGLPSSVIVQNVLLKLPVKSIIMCKSVCKAWYALISDPEFAKLHFAQAEICIIGRPWISRSVSRILYLVEPEDNSGFDDFCMDFTKCKIPVSVAEEKVDNFIERLNRKNEATGRPCIWFLADYRYELVNSCNGLLCLSKSLCNDPQIVCNPITGEFIHLPESKNESRSAFCNMFSALGFSPKTNQYKVIRTFHEGPPQRVRMMELHTLGTHSWKCARSAPTSAANIVSPFPTYLKVELYWLYYENSYHIASFDFDNEQFQPVPPPPFQLEKFHHVSLGALGDSLCVCDARHNYINVWVMQNYGAQKSWTQKMSINTDDGVWWSSGSHYRPMKYYKNGGLLMFDYRTDSFAYYHPRNYQSLIHLKLPIRSRPEFEAISHVPSFISLKDILVGDDVEVLNINSRCADCKFPGESRGLAWVKVDADIQSYSDKMKQKYSWW